MSDFVWKPSEEFLARANLTRLMRRIGAASYADLHRISIDEPERFWPEVVDDPVPPVAGEEPGARLHNAIQKLHFLRKANYRK